MAANRHVGDRVLIEERSFLIMASSNHSSAESLAESLAEESWDSMHMSFLHFLAQDARSDVANYGNDQATDMSGSTRHGSDLETPPVPPEDRRWISVAEFRARRTGILYPVLPPLSGLPPLAHLQATGDDDDDAWEEGDLEQLFQLDVSGLSTPRHNDFGCDG